MKNTRTIEWINGLKGIACILIFLHHFCLAFYPAIHYGDAAVSHLAGFDTRLAQSPISFILNGNFLVALFCVISGILISISVMELEDRDKISNVIVKRYLRLMLPIIPVGLFVWIMLITGGFSNVEAASVTLSPWLSKYYTGTLTLKETLESIFINIWFYGDNRLSTAFWMLKDLFYGTFLSMILSMVSWKMKRFAWIVYVIVIVCYWKSPMQLAFVLGTCLAWVYLNAEQLFNKYVGIILVIVGLFLGGYPSGVIPNNIYSVLNGNAYVFIHVIGAFLFLYGVWSCKGIQKIFSLPIFRALGKISYAVYLLHIPLLFSVTTSIFLMLVEYMGYTKSVLTTLVISSIVLLITSYFYNKFIEKAANILQIKVLTFLIG